MVQIIGRNRTINSVTVERLIEITIGVVVVDKAAIVYIVTIDCTWIIHIGPVKSRSRVINVSRLAPESPDNQYHLNK